MVPHDVNMWIMQHCLSIVGRDVLCLQVRRPSFYIPSPEQFAKSAVRTIGIAPETTGYFSHQIQVSDAI